MSINGKKISALEELASIQGDEYIPVLSGNTNKKLGIGKLAKKEDIPDTSQLATKEELKSKLDTATYNSEKANFATKTELGNKANKIGTENVSEDTKELQPNKFYIFSEVATLTITLASGEENVLSEYMFQFTSGSTPTVLNLPESVKWIGDNTIEASKTYQVSIVNNLAVMGGV